jgi:hypothetical protein
MDFLVGWVPLLLPLPLLSIIALLGQRHGNDLAKLNETYNKGSSGRKNRFGTKTVFTKHYGSSGNESKASTTTNRIGRRKKGKDMTMNLRMMRVYYLYG